MIDKNFIQKCQAFIEPNRFRLDEPMKLHTTFKIGGPADCLIFPASMEETEKVLALVSEYKLPLTILGNGSNVLVQDKGIRGVVVKFARPMAKIRHEGTRIIAGAGALLKDASEAAAQSSLTGLEFACGIPGSIGGAVFMNAGAYGGETKDCLESATVVTRDGEVKTYTNAELHFSYRHSLLQENDEIVISATFALKAGDKATILDQMNYLNALRSYKQPLEYPSCGSVFKRPTGHFVGPMIIQAGLQGKQIGGAQVSTKHAGFIVNKGGATATDYLNLIHYIQKTIKEKDGIALQTEVRIIGEE